VRLALPEKVAAQEDPSKRQAADQPRRTQDNDHRPVQRAKYSCIRGHHAGHFIAAVAVSLTEEFAPEG